jgi:hypothetical protein
MALSSLPVFYITSSFLKKNLSKKFLKQILFIILNNLSLYIYSFGSFCSSLSPKSKKGGGRKKRSFHLERKACSLVPINAKEGKRLCICVCWEAHIFIHKIISLSLRYWSFHWGVNFFHICFEARMRTMIDFFYLHKIRKKRSKVGREGFLTPEKALSPTV